MLYTPKIFIKTTKNSLKSSNSTKISKNNSNISWMNQKEHEKIDRNQ